MNNLGMKIVGDELEVGFTVSSREELALAISQVMMMAVAIWKDETAPKEPEKNSVAEYQKHIEPVRDRIDRTWREQQGLR
jgi:hypothetical protein